MEGRREGGKEGRREGGKEGRKASHAMHTESKLIKDNSVFCVSLVI